MREGEMEDQGQGLEIRAMGIKVRRSRGRERWRIKVMRS
jgi:hypothetical protein